jgi:hypothetical protein
MGDLGRSLLHNKEEAYRLGQQNIGQNKKHNPPSTDQPEQPTIPRELPPLRTFVVRQFDPSTGEMFERQVDAHGLAIDESRMITFIVFFWADPETQVSMVQTSKLVLNSDAWLEVEELNLNFPTLATH